MGSLRDELINDPLGRGYSAMTDAQVVAALHLRDRSKERTIMSAGEVMEHIVGSEFTALTADKKARVDRVLALGAEIIIGPGNNHNAVQELLAAFGAGSQTVTNLSAARAETIDRAGELGLGTVRVGEVERARV